MQQKLAVPENDYKVIRINFGGHGGYVTVDIGGHSAKLCRWRVLGHRAIAMVT
jgi:hypothetical protein